MKPSDIACIILASGVSERFGEADKLSARLGENTVLETVIKTVESIHFGQVYVVSPIQKEGSFTWVENNNPAKGQGHSLRLGLRMARDAGWKNSVIALGDMPLVQSVNFVNLITKNNKKQMVVSEFESVRMPPVYLGATVIDKILAQQSPIGAREIFDMLQPLTVPISADSALDVDTLEDLDRVRNILAARKLEGTDLHD
ncbi:4-diphosphocytidyl-2C-methyl-D-erythritol kinase [Litorimonas cladophorae]|uniref:4-diphosphocytidyl-2C-methyl-D-erythritol kinase n=1 Tax=Litorimonas cladophorae TaxID=1220491 RepID=A0A918KHG4_9PROT|nr:nucleotidyltransferase family protein [Litorimonas cladophorae]GGX62761.1 4-diphosphocytidyl-2C-methyl-D-erythritol kinase [Litorimonas cladophorae]